MHRVGFTQRSARVENLAAVLLVLLIGCSSADAQPPQTGVPTSTEPVVSQAPPTQEAAAAGLTLVCEVYCSETELRTANARIRWKLVPGPALDAARGQNLSAAEQRLETTVFKDGFTKDLYVTLPVTQAGNERAVPSAALARQGKSTLRAYQIRIVDFEKPRSAELFAAGTAETVAVVENLEPGMNYTWRLVIEAGATDLVSPVVRCRAPICPADMVREENP